MDIRLLNFLLDNLPGNMSNNPLFNSHIRTTILTKKNSLLVSLSKQLYDILQKKYNFANLHGIEIIDSESEEIRFESSTATNLMVCFCKKEKTQTNLNLLTANNKTLTSTTEKITENKEGFTHEICFAHNPSLQSEKVTKNVIFNTYDATGKLLNSKISSPVKTVFNNVSQINSDQHDYPFRRFPLPPKTNQSKSFPMSEACIISDLEFYLTAIYESRYQQQPSFSNFSFLKILEKNLKGITSNPQAKIILSFRLLAQLVQTFNNHPVDGYSELLIEDNYDFIKVGLYLQGLTITSFPKKISREEAEILYQSDPQNQERESLKEIFDSLNLN